MDGHYCGHCTTKVASAVSDALEGVELLDVSDIKDVGVSKDDLLVIRVRRGESE